MRKAAVFDADGTLIDTMPIWYEVGARYLATCGIEAPEGLWRRYFTMGLEESAIDMKEHFKLPQPVEEIRQGYLDIVDHFYRYEVQPKPGAIEFLKSLKERGIPAVLATANSATLACASLERLGVLDCFKDAVSCEDFKTTKKEPLIYEKAAGLVGAVPTETVVFEDILLAVTTAKNDGFYTVAMEDGASSKEREDIKSTADLYVTDYAEIDIDLLFKL